LHKNKSSGREKNAPLIKTLRIHAEAVEKPKKYDFKVYNYLILLNVKFGKMPKFGFFDNIAIKHTYHV